MQILFTLFLRLNNLKHSHQIMKGNVFFILVLVLYGCIESNPNESAEAVVESQTVNYVGERKIDSTMTQQKIYVPIYSDIYQKSRTVSTLLTATLSIRNTSEKDSLFLSRVDYFNTKGDLVRNYLKNDIYLQPLETIDYVIEERDTLGGSGANFIVQWYGTKHLTPVIQAVMVGGLASRVFSFTTEGTLVNE